MPAVGDSYRSLQSKSRERERRSGDLNVRSRTTWSLEFADTTHVQSLDNPSAQMNLAGLPHPSADRGRHPYWGRLCTLPCNPRHTGLPLASLFVSPLFRALLRRVSLVQVRILVIPSGFKILVIGFTPKPSSFQCYSTQLLCCRFSPVSLRHQCSWATGVPNAHSGLLNVAREEGGTSSHGEWATVTHHDFLPRIGIF